MRIGAVVDSLRVLVCDTHLGVPFVSLDIIPNSSMFVGKGKRELHVYRCSSCTGDESGSTAYDCPRCGVVVGSLDRRLYSPSETSWPAGDIGEHYHCINCGIQVGFLYEKTR